MTPEERAALDTLRDAGWRITEHANRGEVIGDGILSIQAHGKIHRRIQATQPWEVRDAT